MRILLHPALGVGNVHHAEHLHGLVHGVAASEALVEPDGLGDLLTDREDRIERRHRLLEDHRDLLAADLPHLRRRQVQEVPAVVEDLTLDDAAGRLGDQPHDAERRHALAAARLAHHAERLAGLDVEVDAVDRANHALVGEEVGLEPSDVQQSLGHGFSCPALGVPARASSGRGIASPSASLWVTQRMAVGPMAWTFPVRAAQPCTISCVATSAERLPPAPTAKITMFVCTLARSIRIPGSLATPSASARAFTWSSASRPTIRSSATIPAAAMIPACRMPPPTILRRRRARVTTSGRPQITEPTGAPRPFERQNVTVSTSRVKSRASRRRATAALKRRAPSRWTGTPAPWATAATAAISSGVQQVPP